MIVIQSSPAFALVCTYLFMHHNGCRYEQDEGSNGTLIHDYSYEDKDAWDEDPEPMVRFSSLMFFFSFKMFN